MPKPSIITIGSIGRPHGINGWMRLNSFTDPAENILNYPTLFIAQNQSNHDWQPINIKEYTLHGAHILIKLEHCDTPEDARFYTNAAIGISHDQLPALPEDEYYWSDLEGLTVINQQGIILGKIDHLFSTGANDVIVVKHDDTTQRLLPYVKDCVVDVNLEKQEMYVDWDADFCTSRN